MARRKGGGEGPEEGGRREYKQETVPGHPDSRLLSPFAILWPVSSILLFLFFFLLLILLFLFFFPTLFLSLLDIQTNKLGGPPGLGPRMNHLKQWNAD